jgi:hypothetical protein
MKYTAHMQSSEYAGMECTAEFEVDPDEIEGLDEDAIDSFLSDRAIEALTESSVNIWYEEG